METIQAFLETIETEEKKQIFQNIFSWMQKTFPELESSIRWKQPMYTDHGTFIIAFSNSKHNLLIGPEQKAVNHFSERIKSSKHKHTKMLIQMAWNKPIDFDLIEAIIRFNIEDKKTCKTFWRTS